MNPRTFILNPSGGGSFTFATLPTSAQLQGEIAGIQAYTSDVGPVYWNGTQWVATVTGVANANGGQTEIIQPQNKTGFNVNAANWLVDTGSATFTGNIYNDPVMAIGYNVVAFGTNGALSTTSPDPFSLGLWVEADYQVGNTATPGTTGSTVTASASNSTTVLVDSAQTWNTNSWANWVLYNITSGGRALIASNTATTVTTTAPMVIADGVTAARANQTGDSYNIYDRLLETYFEAYQVTSNGSANRRIRPLYFTFDKATAAAQGALVSGAALVISAATAANPAAFTTSVNHGLQAGSRNYVKFGSNGTSGQSNLAGGTWGTNFNAKQYLVTVTGATTFTVAVNATGFGTYTASSGTCTVEGAVNSSSILFDPIYNGMVFALPSWNATAQDNVLVLFDSLLTLFGRQGSNSNLCQFKLNADVGGSASLWGGVSSTPYFEMRAEPGVNSTSWDLYTWNAGAGPLVSLSVYRPNNTDVAFTVSGGNQGYVTGLLNLSSNGMTASRPIITVRPAVSQTGDYIDCWDSTGNTTKVFSVNSSGAIGVNSTAPPAKVTGFGTPTGTGVIANFAGASATLAQCSQAIAQLITDMKGIGFYGT